MAETGGRGFPPGKFNSACFREAYGYQLAISSHGPNCGNEVKQHSLGGFGFGSGTGQGVGPGFGEGSGLGVGVGVGFGVGIGGLLIPQVR